jgi:hypothetical protein
MKSKMAAFWFVVSVALGGLLFAQVRHNRSMRMKLEAIQVQLESFSGDLRQTVGERETLQKERAELQKELASTQDALTRAEHAKAEVTNPASPNARQLSAAQQTQNSGATGSSRESGGMGKLLGDMMKNPEMRKAMEQQQRVALDMMYDPLIKQLQLTPDQAKKFKDLLIDQQMNNMSQAGALLEPGADRAEAAQKLGAQQKDRDAQMKELLGDDKFAQLQQYNQTVGERAMLEQFGKGLDISADQKEQLLALMGEEKKNVQINTGLTTNPNKDFQAVLGAPEMAEKLMAQQEQVNERVLERATQFLTPEQVQKLEPVLKSQLDMQRAGMKMAQQMFGNSSGQADGTVSQGSVPVAPPVSSPH